MAAFYRYFIIACALLSLMIFQFYLRSAEQEEKRFIPKIKEEGERRLTTTDHVCDTPSREQNPRKRVIRHALLDHGLEGNNMAAPLLYRSFQKVRGGKSQMIVDVGAYDGMDYSLEGARNGLIVMSFEPSKQNIIKWKENLKQYQQITTFVPLTEEGKVNGTFHIPAVGPALFLLNAAVSDYTGSIKFYDSVGPMNSVVNQDFHGYQKGEEVTVSVVRIDDILPPDTKIFLFKTDTQGNEFGVLRGAKNLFKQGSVEYLQLEFWPAAIRSANEDPVELLNYIFEELGMDCYEIFSKRTNWQDHFKGSQASFEDYVAWLEEIKPDKSQKLSLGGWSELVCWI